MHELKFRAWHKKEKIWSEQFKLFDITDGFIDFGNFKFGYADDVIVCQFTGLHDKNGVEIYEGDIVRFSFGIEDHIDVVSFDEEFGAYLLETGWKDDSYPCYLAQTKVEIIGNVYKNPELFKG